MRTYRVPLDLTPQAEGGYVVTSPVLPELLTEGDTLEEALHHADDAFAAVVEMYEDSGRPLPPGILIDADNAPIRTERVLQESA